MFLECGLILVWMPATSFPRVLPVIPLIGVGGLKAYATCETMFSLCAVALSTLSGMGVYPPVVAVEALKVRFDQAPLPLSACPIPEEAVADTSVAYVFTEDLCTTYVGLHGSAQ